MFCNLQHLQHLQFVVPRASYLYTEMESLLCLVIENNQWFDATLERGLLFCNLQHLQSVNVYGLNLNILSKSAPHIHVEILSTS